MYRLICGWTKWGDPETWPLTFGHQPLGKHIHRRIAPGDAPAGLSKRPWYQRDIKRSSTRKLSSNFISKGSTADLDFTWFHINISPGLCVFHAQQLVASFTHQAQSRALPTRGWTWRIPWRPQVASSMMRMGSQDKVWSCIEEIMIGIMGIVMINEVWSSDQVHLCNGLVLI